jgi:hypothetical protein
LVRPVRLEFGLQRSQGRPNDYRDGFAAIGGSKAWIGGKLPVKRST